MSRDDLPVPSARSEVDRYEREFMPTASPAIRQRTGVPGGTFAAAVVVVGGLALLAAGWKLGVVALLAAVWLLFSVLRIAVDDVGVHVHFGWMRRHIPLHAITEVRSTRYSIAGGFGMPWMRRTPHGLVFAVPGSGGRGVSITFTDERGRTRTWVLASRAPDALRDAIARMRDAQHDDDHALAAGDELHERALGPADSGRAAEHPGS